MSELQPAEISAEPAPGPTETVESGSELATDSQGQGEENVQNSESPEVKRINQITGQRYAEKRRADRAEKELAALKQQQQQAQLDVTAPEVPPMPDHYELDDDEFKVKTTEREVAIQRKATFDGQQLALRQAQEQQVLVDQQARQAKMNEVQNGFFNNAKTNGVDQTDLNTAITTLNDYGISEDLGAAIMQDTEGPQIATFLAANPSEYEALISANTLEIGDVYKAIKQKASALIPKQSQAPSPTMVLSGNGAPEIDEFKKRHPNAVFE